MTIAQKDAELMTEISPKFAPTDAPVLNVDDAGGKGLPVIFQHGLCGDARQPSKLSLAIHASAEWIAASTPANNIPNALVGRLLAELSQEEARKAFEASRLYLRQGGHRG